LYLMSLCLCLCVYKCVCVCVCRRRCLTHPENLSPIRWRQDDARAGGPTRHHGRLRCERYCACVTMQAKREMLRLHCNCERYFACVTMRYNAGEEKERRSYYRGRTVCNWNVTIRCRRLARRGARARLCRYRPLSRYILRPLARHEPGPSAVRGHGCGAGSAAAAAARRHASEEAGDGADTTPHQ